MSVIFWPSTLPQKPRSQTLSVSPRSMVASFAPENGVELTRPRITAPIHVMEFTWPTMTEAQAVIFREFFDVTTKGGALPFAWQDPRTDEWFMWKPVPTGPAYQESHAGPDSVSFSVTLVRQPMQPWWVTYVPPSGTDVPDVLLDFMNGIYAINGNRTTMKGALTISRDSIGSYFDSDGVMKYAPVDRARMDYDPATLTLRGLLLERYSQNLNLYSQDFATGWSTNNATLTAAAAVGLDGTTSAGEITENGVSGGHYITRTYGAIWTSGNVYVVSRYFKRAVGTRHALIFLPSGVFGASVVAGFNLGTGVATVVVSGTSTTAGMEDAGNGWYRCWVKSTATTTASGDVTDRIGNSSTSGAAYTGDSTSSIYIWGAQIEIDELTSYMLSTSTPYLREDDVTTIEASRLPAGFDVAGTMQCKMTSGHSTGNAAFNRALMFTDNGDLNNRISFVMNDVTGSMEVFTGGVAQAQISVGAVASGATANFAGAYAANDFAVSKNGGAVSTDAAGTVPPVDMVTIHQRMRRVHYHQIALWASRLSNTDLVALSA